MSRRLARVAGTGAAAACLVAGIRMTRPAAARALEQPALGSLLRLTGPFRGLPAPFLWHAWGEAKSRWDIETAIVIGQWLTWLYPERRDLFSGFAYELAYDALAVEPRPERRAALVLDAVRMLDEGKRLHPGEWRFDLDANFILVDRCTGGPGAERVRTAFRSLTGHDPLEVASAHARAARAAAPHLPLAALRRAMTDELRALDAVASGDVERAARIFAEAAEVWRGIEPDRAALLTSVSEILPRGIRSLPAELRKRLIADHRLGRKPEVWSGAR